MLSDGPSAVKGTPSSWVRSRRAQQNDNDAVGFVSDADVESLFVTPPLISAKIFRARGSKRAQRPR